MVEIALTLPDGKQLMVEYGMPAIKAVEKIGQRLARDAIAVKLDGIQRDLSFPIESNAKFEVLTFNSPEGKEVFWHSSAHIMAEAVIKLFPDAKPTIGPSIENGFYYDFAKKEPFTPDDIVKIEEEMKKIIAADSKFVRKEFTHVGAKKIFHDNPYKLELIETKSEDTEGHIVSVYYQGENEHSWFDLCRGPHLPSTGRVKAFKILKLAGAYWKADSNNAQLQRIYGISYPDKKMLDDYLKLIEEAEKRDHKKIGKELDLFTFSEHGQGFPFFKPKGVVMWNLLMDYWNEVHRKWNYKIVKTPIMLNKSLWEISGHWMNYRENMYTLKIDDSDFAIKPMNCPGAILVYSETSHSYKEFPLRMGEIGLVHRHELSGVLNGLFRVRAFHQDDAHIFMTQNHIADEVLNVLKVADEIYSTFGLTYHLELSTRPEKSIGSDEAWELSTNALKKALVDAGKEFKINEGDGAFYGPKIDIHIKDALGRTWQCGTIQLDMNLPERFDLHYVDDKSVKQRPVMVHRVIYGSLERFFGIIIEHFAGRFPLWLSPVQVRLLTIANRHEEFAKEIMQKYFDAGIRVEIDDNADTLPYKVRKAQMDQVNYILVIGDKEVESKTVNVRTRDNQVLGAMNPDELLLKLQKEIREKTK